MFIGRENETSILSDSLHKTLKGKGQVVFISGEAGMGKTTLVDHWWKQISEDFGRNPDWSKPVFAKTSCSIPVGGINVGELEALQPFTDIMNSLCLTTAQDKKSSKKVTDILLESAPYWFNAIPIVGSIASAGVKTYNIYRKEKNKTRTDLSGVANQQQIFQQYSNFLNGLSDKVSAVVLWIDDIHWADKSSLNLLFYLSRQITSRPILVIAAYRPEEIIQSSSEAHTLLKIKNEIIRYELGQIFNLGYFNKDEINQFLNASFKNYTADEKFEKWLLKISGGNALFISQYVKTLTEDGYIDSEGTISPEYSAITEPQTVNAVIQERIRRLDEQLLDMLRYATAEGEEFTSYIVSKLTGRGSLDVLKALKSAGELGLIRQSGNLAMYSPEKTTVYTFTHALFYTALYDSLNEEEKTILHRQCFDVLKTEWDKNKNNNLLSTKLLAHAEKCGKYYEAAEIAYLCGKDYWSRYSLPEARELFQRVINLSNIIKTEYTELYENQFKPTILSEVTFYLADTISRIGFFDDALIQYEAAAYLYGESGKEIGLVNAKNGISYILGRKTRYKESLQSAEDALRIAEKLNYEYGMSAALGNIASAKAGLNENESAIEFYKKGIEIARNIEPKSGEAHYLYMIGSILFNLGRHKEAEQYLDECIVKSRMVNYRNGEASANCILALLKAEKENFDDAIELLNSSLRIYTESGDRFAQAWVLNKLGIIELNRENLTVSLSLLKRSIEIYRELNTIETIASSLMFVARVHLMNNELDECEKNLNESLQISGKIDNKLLTGLLEGEFGYLAEKRGDIRSSNSHFENCVRILSELNYSRVSEWENELKRIKSIMS